MLASLHCHVHISQNVPSKNISKRGQSLSYAGTGHIIICFKFQHSVQGSGYNLSNYHEFVMNQITSHLVTVMSEWGIG